jgi:hypothetical protein
MCADLWAEERIVLQKHLGDLHELVKRYLTGFVMYIYFSLSLSLSLCNSVLFTFMIFGTTEFLDFSIT